MEKINEWNSEDNIVNFVSFVEDTIYDYLKSFKRFPYLTMIRKLIYNYDKWFIGWFGCKYKDIDVENQKQIDNILKEKFYSMKKNYIRVAKNHRCLKP